MRKIRNNSLYLVLSGEYNKKRDVRDIAARAIAGGVDIIQMREKTLPKQELIDLGDDL